MRTTTRSPNLLSPFPLLSIYLSLWRLSIHAVRPSVRSRLSSIQRKQYGENRVWSAFFFFFLRHESRHVGNVWPEWCDGYFQRYKSQFARDIYRWYRLLARRKSIGKRFHRTCTNPWDIQSGAFRDKRSYDFESFRAKLQSLPLLSINRRHFENRTCLVSRRDNDWHKNNAVWVIKVADETLDEKIAGSPPPLRLSWNSFH